MTQPIPLARLVAALSAPHSSLAEPPDRLRTRQAAVALLLRGGARGAELLYIQRSAHPDDPWSGHFAFPGGHREARDPDLLTTARRETHEEIGVDLGDLRPAGRLRDRPSLSARLRVACFVFVVPVSTPLRPDPGEVERAFWVPAHFLRAPDRRRELSVEGQGGDPVRVPAVDILGTDLPLLWGLTLAFTAELMALAGHPLPGVHLR